MERVRYIDALRVGAMFLVILLHSMTRVIAEPVYYGTVSWNICIVLYPICRCAVPLSFMMSGYLLLSDRRTEEIKPFYRQKLPRLLIPLLCWNVIFFLYFASVGEKERSFSAFFGGLVNNGNCYHMWYVYTLIGSYLLAPFLRRMTEKLSAGELFLLLAVLLTLCSVQPFLNIVQPVHIHLSDPLMDGYVCYFLLGYLLGNFTISKKMRILIYLGGIVGFAISVGGNTAFCSEEKIDLVFNNGYAITHFLIASAVFTWARQSRMLAGKTAEDGGRADSAAGGRADRIIQKLSAVSFGVYWIHPVFLDLYERYCSLELSPIRNVALSFMAAAAASVALSLLLWKVRPLRKYLM